MIPFRLLGGREASVLLIIVLRRGKLEGAVAAADEGGMGRIRVLAAAILVFASAAGGAEEESGRVVLSGHATLGERWNEPLFEDDADRDDEAVERYSFHHYDLVLDKRLAERTTLSLRFDRRDRTYDLAPLRDNTTDRLGARLRYDATERLAIWLAASIAEKDYERSTLDNTPRDASVEARYRWGVRNLARIGFDYSEARYDQEPGRDRTRRRAFAAWERPVTEAFVLELKGDVEDRGFRTPSAARQNSTSRSVTVGFRWEPGAN